ncbi:hypothetical protein C0585_05310 [Candidatus Woesearchaeota archaeon]|nr:MAG: hypothetical protein C0585_05310 [Candidatus Woesearchaeota archaeon]
MKKAKDIAVDSLRACYTDRGIYAGRKHFDDYWARDSFYASWGALEIGDLEIVKHNLLMFLNDMKYNGQLPLRIGVSSFGQVLKFFGIKLKQSFPTYFQDKLGSHPQDQNSLFLITFKKYIEKTNDLEFLEDKFDNLRSIINWYENEKKEGLIYGGKYATWQDAIKKVGWTLYNNVLYFEALKSMDYLQKKLELNKDKYKKLAEETKKLINKKFWIKNYYADFICKKTCEIFSLDGNTLAVIFGVADNIKSKKIGKHILDTKIIEPFGAKTNNPKYKSNETFIPYYLFHMQDYQNEGVHWLWLGALATITLNKSGYKKEAKNALKNIEKIIEKHQIVSEVYTKEGNPVKRLFYRSEQPFAWSSSLYLLAEDEIKNNN